MTLGFIIATGRRREGWFWKRDGAFRTHRGSCSMRRRGVIEPDRPPTRATPSGDVYSMHHSRHVLNTEQPANLIENRGLRAGSLSRGDVASAYQQRGASDTTLRFQYRSLLEPFTLSSNAINQTPARDTPTTLAPSGVVQRYVREISAMRPKRWSERSWSNRQRIS